jgi:hypothetical protein
MCKFISFVARDNAYYIKRTCGQTAFSVSGVVSLEEAKMVSDCFCFQFGTEKGKYFPGQNPLVLFDSLSEKTKRAVVLAIEKRGIKSLFSVSEKMKVENSSGFKYITFNTKKEGWTFLRRVQNHTFNVPALSLNEAKDISDVVDELFLGRLRDSFRYGKECIEKKWLRISIASKQSIIGYCKRLGIELNKELPLPSSFDVEKLRLLQHQRESKKDFGIKKIGLLTSEDWQEILGQEVLTCKKTVHARALELGVHTTSLFRRLEKSEAFKEFYASRGYSLAEYKSRKASKIEVKICRLFSAEEIFQGQYLFKNEKVYKFQLDL